MRKFMLVVFIGVVLEINLYGIINEIIEHYESNSMVEVIDDYTTVYME